MLKNGPMVNDDIATNDYPWTQDHTSPNKAPHPYVHRWVNHSLRVYDRGKLSSLSQDVLGDPTTCRVVTNGDVEAYGISA
jgi:hypothetical protein